MTRGMPYNHVAEYRHPARVLSLARCWPDSAAALASVENEKRRRAAIDERDAAWIATYPSRDGRIVIVRLTPDPRT